MVDKKRGRKKVIKKRVNRKSSSRKSSVVSPVKMNRSDELLMQNFVGLQKVIVELSLKLNDLSLNMSKLLKLFEVSAEALVKKEFHVEKETNKEITDKLNFLLEQNKVVARGLTLMNERPSFLESSPQQISSQVNMAPVPFQRVSGGLTSPVSSNVSPQQNFVPSPKGIPQSVEKQEVPMEVPGSEEEENK